VLKKCCVADGLRKSKWCQAKVQIQIHGMTRLNDLLLGFLFP